MATTHTLRALCSGFLLLRHKDDNMWNNNPRHLVCLATSQNGLHATGVLGVNAGEGHGASKLTRRDVGEIARLCRKGRLGFQEIAERFGVHPSNVTRIRQRQTWKHVN